MKAFLFDLNGTMIDDMEYHTDAWFAIINDELGRKLSRDDVKKEMYGKNVELLIRVFGEGHFTQEEMHEISIRKEIQYREAFRPKLKLLNGLNTFVEDAYQEGIKMAIGTAAITSNVDFVLDGLNVRKYFPVVISADDVQRSKPDPETFVLAAEQLGVKPEDCIVFEDNPKGVEAALNGGMKAVVITTMHTKEEFDDLPNILKFIGDYTDPFLKTLIIS